jgi:hypothetical protein
VRAYTERERERERGMYIIIYRGSGFRQVMHLGCTGIIIFWDTLGVYGAALGGSAIPLYRGGEGLLFF